MQFTSHFGNADKKFYDSGDKWLCFLPCLGKAWKFLCLMRLWFTTIANDFFLVPNSSCKKWVIRVGDSNDRWCSHQKFILFFSIFNMTDSYLKVKSRRKTKSIMSRMFHGVIIKSRHEYSLKNWRCGTLRHNLQTSKRIVFFQQKIRFFTRKQSF